MTAATGSPAARAAFWRTRSAFVRPERAGPATRRRRPIRSGAHAHVAAERPATPTANRSSAVSVSSLAPSRLGAWGRRAASLHRITLGRGRSTNGPRPSVAGSDVAAMRPDDSPVAAANWTDRRSATRTARPGGGEVGRSDDRRPARAASKGSTVPRRNWLAPRPVHVGCRRPSSPGDDTGDSDPGAVTEQARELIRRTAEPRVGLGLDQLLPAVDDEEDARRGWDQP